MGSIDSQYSYLQFQRVANNHEPAPKLIGSHNLREFQVGCSARLVWYIVEPRGECSRESMINEGNS